MNTKLDVGNVFERIFRIYREQFTLLVPAALVLFVPVAILIGAVQTGGGVLAVIVAGVLGAVAGYWYQGMVVEAALDIMDGRRDHTVGSLLTSVTPVIVPLLVAGLLAGIGIGIGFILLIAPGLFLLTIWAVIAPVIVVERSGALGSFGRSRELVRGHGWQVFAVIVVLFLLNLVLGAVVQLIFVGISDSIVGFALSNLLTNVLVAPLSALAAAVMYFELKRMAGEGAVPAGAAVTPAAPGPEAPAPPAPGPQAPGPHSPAPERPDSTTGE